MSWEQHICRSIEHKSLSSYLLNVLKMLTSIFKKVHINHSHTNSLLYCNLTCILLFVLCPRI